MQPKNMDNTREPIDPRNDEDYDTWDVGMEPIPGDHTWHSPPRQPSGEVSPGPINSSND
jgi:hypothetical protein